MTEKKKQKTGLRAQDSTKVNESATFGKDDVKGAVKMLLLIIGGLESEGIGYNIGLIKEPDGTHVLTFSVNLGKWTPPDMSALSSVVDSITNIL